MLVFLGVLMVFTLSRAYFSIKNERSGKQTFLWGLASAFSFLAFFSTAASNQTIPTNQTSVASESISHDTIPDPTDPPAPATCTKAAEKAERNQLATHYGYESTDAMDAGSSMMNAEASCAVDEENASHHASAAHHYALTAMAYLYMAVHAPDMLGSKKTDLEGAVQSAGMALNEDGVSGEDQKLASDTKESAQEKLEAIQNSQ